MPPDIINNFSTVEIDGTKYPFIVISTVFGPPTEFFRTPLTTGDAAYDAVFRALPRGSSLEMAVLVKSVDGAYRDWYFAVMTIGAEGVVHQVRCENWADVLAVARTLRDEYHAQMAAWAEQCKSKDTIHLYEDQLRKPEIGTDSESHRP